MLLQIFGHLHPKDVLNISRSTKSLRSLLTERHARGVWRASLASVRALPACPCDMTEIQYASLAFDEWCTVSPRFLGPVWQAPIREGRSPTAHLIALFI